MKIKKLISMTIVLVMFIAYAPVSSLLDFCDDIFAGKEAFAVDAYAAEEGEEAVTGDGIVYQYVDGVAMITGYNGNAKNLVIPEKINGNVVTKIFYRAFEGTSVVNVTIPASITEISWYYWADDDGTISYPHGPFAGSNVKKVTFAAGTKTIPEAIFGGCRGLEEIVFPDSVKVIEKDAFVYCTSLTKVKLPKSLETIEYRGFGYCANITAISLPSATKTLGEAAFFYCLSLKKAELNKVQTLGESCFVGTAIEEIVIPKTLTVADFYYEAETDSISYSHGPFAGYELKKAVFEDGTKTIPAYVLGGCRSLTSVTIPDSVKVIGNDAFVYCSALAKVTLPSSLETIDERAFGYCSAITTIKLPDATKTLGGKAFYYCTSLTSVKLSKVKSIGEYCFVATDIQKITLPKTLTTTDFYYDGELDTDAYAHGPFAGYELKSVTFEDGTKEVPAYVLAGCRVLTSVTLPDSVKLINKNAFAYCTTLTEIKIPEGLETIGKEAFAGCSELEFIRLYEKIKSIAEDSFDGLYVLTKEDIGTITDIIDDEISYRAIIAGIKDKEQRLLDREKSYYELRKDSNGNSTLTINYSFKDSVIKNISDVEIKVKLPEETEFEYIEVAVDGKKWNDFCFDDGVLVIENLKKSGKITIKNLVDIGEEFSSYAQISGKNSKKNFVETIGIINPMNYSAKYEISAVKNNKTVKGLYEESIAVSKSAMPIDLVKATNATEVKDKNGNIVEEEALTTGMILSRYIGNIEVDFREISVLGDIDGDTKITSADARFALRVAVGLEKTEPETAEFTAADANRDGKITSADARLILRAAVDLEKI